LVLANWMAKVHFDSLNVQQEHVIETFVPEFIM